MTARTPEPPYYAVIFTSTRTAVADGYDDMSKKMVELAAQQPGFLGVESARGEDGLGITVSYWESEEAIANWRRHAEHRIAQSTGIEKWYAQFTTRVARVERVRAFEREGDNSEDASGKR
jgi:heme-degrading monooxygenase HmoA